jgi:hypothetical protein
VPQDEECFIAASPRQCTHNPSLPRFTAIRITDTEAAGEIFKVLPVQEEKEDQSGKSRGDESNQCTDINNRVLFRSADHTLLRGALP